MPPSPFRDKKSGIGCPQRNMIAVLVLVCGLGLSACQSNNIQPVSDVTLPQANSLGRGLSADELKPLEAQIQASMDKHNIQGLSIALFDRVGPVWARGFGYSDAERDLSADANTIYRVGSLAKPVTALAVMQMADQERIDIDQPLSTYLPGFSSKKRFTQAAPVTVRQILHHHSGLPGNIIKGMWSDQHFSQVRQVMRNEYPAYPPDFVFGYSNVGYSLLGDMLESITGSRYEEYVQSQIFDPLGMTHSFFDSVRTNRSVEFPSQVIAQAYDNGQRAEILPIRDLPALGLYSSALDMAALGSSLLNEGHGLLMPGTFDEMSDVQNADIPLDLQIKTGLGWFLDKGRLANVGRVISHGGNTLYFGGRLVILPDRGIGVVVLGNTRGVRRVAQALSERSLAALLRSRFDIDPLEPVPAAQAETRVGDDQDSILDAAPPEGQFATQFGLINIDADQGEVCACLEGKSLDTVALPDGGFALRERPDQPVSGALKNLERLRFSTQSISGREVMLAHLGDRTEIVGEKSPQTQIPMEWQHRMGQYEVTNPDADFPVTDVRIKEESGHLCLTYRMPKLSDNLIRVPIAAVSSTQAVILGLGRDRGEMVQIIPRKGEDQLCFQGYEARQVSPE